MVKGIRGPDLDPESQTPVVCINAPLSVYGFTNGIKISNLQIKTDTSTLDPIQIYNAALYISNITGPVNLSNLDLNNLDPDGTGLLVSTK